MPEMDGPTMFGVAKARGITAKILATPKKPSPRTFLGAASCRRPLKQLIETVKNNMGRRTYAIFENSNDVALPGTEVRRTDVDARCKGNGRRCA